MIRGTLETVAIIMVAMMYLWAMVWVVEKLSDLCKKGVNYARKKR